MIGEPLRRDDRGERVTHMQRRLNLAGYRVLVDGVFGRHTQAAVAAFLRAHQLGGDGSQISAPALAVLAIEAQTPSPHPKIVQPSTSASSAEPYGAIVVDEGHGSDALGLGDETAAFARIICTRHTEAPLSIGVFGPWGSGKSFFLAQVQEQIEARCRALVRVAAASPLGSTRRTSLEARWHSRIAQVEFNAWHFAEPNLWASLITRVFDELAKILNPEEAIEDTRARLLANVSEGKERQEHATSQVAHAQEAVTEAHKLRRRRQDELEALREELGVVEAAAPVTDGATDAEPTLKVKSPGAAVMITLRWIWSRGKWTRIGIVAGLVLLVAAIVFAILWWLEVPGIRAAFAWLTAALGAVTSAATMAGAWWGKIRKKIDSAKRAYAALAKAKKTGDSVVATAAEGLLAPGTQAMQLARARYEQAEADHETARAAAELATQDLADARRQLRDLEAGRRFYAFIQDRDRSDDYRQHLGLVSMIHEDFSKLDQIVRRVEEEGPGPSAPPPVSRIVLYIDDLDRCEPKRVVEVLQAINLLLSTPLFLVVVAADIGWLRRSLDLYYDRLLAPTSGAAPQVDLGDRPSSQRYLEKVFQIPFVLRSMGPAGFSALIDHTVETARPTATVATPPTSVDTPEDSSPDDEAVVLTATAEEHAELGNAQAVTLTDEEVALAKKLYTVIGTPRLAKAFVHTYRLLRATVRPLSPYLDSNAYEATLTLLALSVGHPRDAERIYEALRSSCAETLGAALRDALPTEPALHRAVHEAGTADVPLAVVHTWLPRVARFSFFLHPMTDA